MNPESSSTLGRALNVLGVAVVAYYFSVLAFGGLAVPIAVLGYIGLAAWLVMALVPRRLLVLTGILALVMVLAGGFAAAPTAGMMVVVPIFGVLRTLGELRRPLWQGITLWLVGSALIAAGVFVGTIPALALVSIEGGLLVAALAGYSRRQFRQTEELARARAEERATSLAQERRQAVARDIHDVLAHSLGGLVIQLDAVEALLEAGRTADAAARVSDARLLAVSGLTEAKRAVEALRADTVQPTVDLSDALDDLVRAHRSLGGVVELERDGTPRPLGDAESTALARAVQESLTNARKHAPGQPVRVAMRWGEHSVSVDISNALPAVAVAAHGGGHGIPGMTERFAGVPGSTVSAGERDGRFVVSAQVAT